MSEPLTTAERAARLARYYDLDLLDVAYDAELYQELAHDTGGPVLELGVGTGRLAVPLALAGHEVLGVDLDPAMLDRAQRAWESARGAAEPDRFTTALGDFRSFRSDRRFRLALMAVNTFLLAPDDATRSAILETMRLHLAPGGVAAIEVGTPGQDELERYDRRLQHEWVRLDPETGEVVSKAISADYEEGEGTLQLTQIYEWTPVHGGPLGRIVQVDLLHLVSAARLGELARASGFGEVRLWGDHRSTPYGATSRRVIIEARLV